MSTIKDELKKKKKRLSETAKLKNRVSKLEDCVKDKDRRIKVLEKRPARVGCTVLVIALFVMVGAFIYYTLTWNFSYEVIAQTAIIICIAEGIIGAVLLGGFFIYLIWTQEDN